jgi:Fic family protein
VPYALGRQIEDVISTTDSNSIEENTTTADTLFIFDQDPIVSQAANLVKEFLNIVTSSVKTPYQYDWLRSLYGESTIINPG